MQHRVNYKHFKTVSESLMRDILEVVQRFVFTTDLQLIIAECLVQLLKLKTKSSTCKLTMNQVLKSLTHHMSGKIPTQQNGD